MIEVAAPQTVEPNLLAEQFEAAGIATTFQYNAGAEPLLTLFDLDEPKRAAAERVVDAHAPVVEPWADRVDRMLTQRAVLTEQGLAAITANLAWLADVLPVVQSGVDAIQARKMPAPPTNLAEINAVLGTLWTTTNDLSIGLETVAQEVAASKNVENALIRLVLEQFDAAE